jgi:A/G-specific adenine glycosylase
MPWRRTRDPYAIWVSEIMLQQTQVATVWPYYERWMAHFPTVHALAVADEQDVLGHWQGLGYYRRCKMLLKGAGLVAQQGFPTSMEGWLEIPGVGRYTACAISSICNGEPVPVVDGNVERVFARLTDSHSPKPKLTNEAFAWGLQNIAGSPGDWNQALMELGATVCKPTNPACESCPLANQCLGFAHRTLASLPVKVAPPKTKLLKHQFTVLYSNGAYGVVQIPQGEWWEGMWSFPKDKMGGEHVRVIGTVKHAVTHHKIEAEIFLAHLSEPSAGVRWVEPGEMANIPMPAPQRKAFKMALAIVGAFVAPGLSLKPACDPDGLPHGSRGAACRL